MIQAPDSQWHVQHFDSPVQLNKTSKWTQFFNIVLNPEKGRFSRQA